ncbi:hypothetical protein SAMN07250955_104258 [Arboricoccus pini]|uniref:Uncharacterized protein n=1 Tax=Arboricoccus pini TaxID=1963835 RepID=A0A212R0B2_9PROT|nr:DUF6111 family protein [Arboricoccus pini]SNB65404.1 hypothetical protein SAMN07250955_104258 [Arboricoccus pini]
MTRIFVILLLLLIFRILTYIVRRLTLGLDLATRSGSLWPTLFLVAMVILIVASVLAFMASGEPPGGTYVPPHLDKKGQVVPGAVQREND